MPGDDLLTAAILVGGKSRRMGTNKALATIRPDGTTVVESVVRALRQVAEEIVLVGSHDVARNYAFLDLPWVADIVPDSGPLGGIHAALTGTGNSHLLVTACDMPFLNVDLLRYMMSLPRGYDVLVPVIGQPQPLHAIYARSCLPLIEESLHEGRYKVSGWFDRANVRTIGESVVAQFDPSLRFSFNVNTPEDLVLARECWAGSRDEAEGA
jgi:molybdopterin-guanine dinucleotide biosynthesis protein A